MENDVFISFAFKDQEIAQKVYDYLLNNGVSCFWCNDLPGGAKYGQEIGKAIMSSKIFILLLSSSAEASDSVYQEVMLAHNSKINTMPVRIENINPIKLAYAIAGNLYFDLFNSPIDGRLKSLLIDVRKQLGMPSSSEVEVNDKEVASAPTVTVIVDNKWHDIEYQDVSQWVNSRMSILKNGKILVAKTFIYRMNRYSGKIQRKLK